MSINIKIDDSEMQKKLNKLSAFPKEIPKASVAALNRALNTAQKTIGKEVSHKYRIRSSEVKSTLKTVKPTASSMRTLIYSSGRRYTLTHFEKNLNTAVRKNTAVKVEVKKGHAKTVNTSPKSFVGRMSGNFLIAKRVGKARYPIVVLKSLSVPQMIATEDVSSKVIEESNKTLQKRIDHEVEYRLNKYMK